MPSPFTSLSVSSNDLLLVVSELFKSINGPSEIEGEGEAKNLTFTANEEVTGLYYYIEDIFDITFVCRTAIKLSFSSKSDLKISSKWAFACCSRRHCSLSSDILRKLRSCVSVSTCYAERQRVNNWCLGKIITIFQPWLFLYHALVLCNVLPNQNNALYTCDSALAFFGRHYKRALWICDQQHSRHFGWRNRRIRLHWTLNPTGNVLQLDSYY